MFLARVAELADAPDLGSGAERRAGSSPVPGTAPYHADAEVALGVGDG